MISASIINNSNIKIKETLKSIENYVDEIILVETKSEIFKVKHPKVTNYFFKWTDDFAEARNYGLSKCKGDWIFIIDSDETLITPLPEVIPEQFDAYCCEVCSENEEIITSYWTLRLFKNKKGIKFDNKLHETIEESIKELNLKLARIQIKINHTGYDIPQEEIKLKAERNLRILLKDKPHRSLNFNMARSYFELQNYNKCIRYGLLALDDNINDDSKAMICNFIHDCYLMQGMEINYKYLTKSITYVPLQVTARYRLVNFLWKHKNKELALKEIKKIQSICHYKNSELSSDIYLDETFINQKIKEIELWQ